MGKNSIFFHIKFKRERKKENVKRGRKRCKDGQTDRKTNGRHKEQDDKEERRGNRSTKQRKLKLRWTERKKKHKIVMRKQKTEEKE
jgi:hypothetical protein